MFVYFPVQWTYSVLRVYLTDLIKWKNRKRTVWVGVVEMGDCHTNVFGPTSRFLFHRVVYILCTPVNEIISLRSRYYGPVLILNGLSGHS